MPPTQLNNKSQLRERPTFNDMLWEQLQDTKTEVRETRKELSARMDRIEQRMDRIDQRMDKLEQRFDKFDAKLDDTRKELMSVINNLRNNVQSPTNYEQIATISTVIVAFGVLYSILSK